LIVCFHTIPATAPANAEGTDVRKIDAFAHILPPAYARRLESIMSEGGDTYPGLRVITDHAAALSGRRRRRDLRRGTQGECCGSRPEQGFPGSAAGA
jgi:hypothetical protein